MSEPTVCAQNGPAPATADISKLTVPQLKALCKERGVTGYSKLGKAALVQKLGLEGDAPAPASAASSSKAVKLSSGTKPKQYGQSGPASSPDSAPSLAASASNSATHETSLAGPSTGIAPDPSASVNTAISAVPSRPASVVAQTLSTSTAASASAPAPPSNISAISAPKDTYARSSTAETPLAANKQVASTTSAPSSKRQPETPLQPQRPHKKSKPTALTPATVGRIQPDSRPPSAAPGPASVFKVPALPVSRATPTPSSGSRPSAPSRVTLSTNARGSISSASTPAEGYQSLTATGKRFKPLLVDKSKSVSAKNSSSAAGSNKTHNITSQKPAALYYLDFPPSASPGPLPPLTLPPSLSQRKHVQRWAVILSGLGPAERNICALVSKTFRYAVYLSAGERLSQNHNGRRLALLHVHHPAASSSLNLWPYLAQRAHETQTRRALFDASFLRAFYAAFVPIASRLWSSPDHERQLGVAVRFLLTRLWFTICIGSARPEWLADTVLDAQEVVPGEIWTVTVAVRAQRRGVSARTESFYVLESTCEVIGKPQLHIAGNGNVTAGDLPVRADWSRYIESRIVPAPTGQHVPLLAHLKWASQGEYERGISRHWLERVEKKGKEGRALRVVAERYVLACVVGNSVSGSWMSAVQMAQEFAGLAEREPGKPRQPQVSMFLPAHHHVESVHFTAASCAPLHPAIAVIHTLAREYFVLKDNGMQIGCEEDGIVDVWQGILGCDQSGMALGPGTIFLAQLVDHVRKLS